MREVYITEAIRSPIGVGKPDRGDLLPLEPVALASRVLGAAVSRAGIGPAALDVLLGCVTPIGDQGANIGRLAALHARFPVEVPVSSSTGYTPRASRLCASATAWPPPLPCP